MTQEREEKNHEWEGRVHGGQLILRWYQEGMGCQPEQLRNERCQAVFSLFFSGLLFSLLSFKSLSAFPVVGFCGKFIEHAIGRLPDTPKEKSIICPAVVHTHGYRVWGLLFHTLDNLAVVPDLFLFLCSSQPTNIRCVSRRRVKL